MTTSTATPVAKRLAQIIAGLNILIVVIGFLAFALPNLSILELEAAIFAAIFGITAIIYSTLGVLILNRQPGHVVGWLFLVTAFFIGLMSLSGWVPLEALNIESDRLNNLLSRVGDLFWILALLLPPTLVLQFFPDGHLPSRRWWPVTAASILVLLNSIRGILAPMPSPTDVTTGVESIILILRIAGEILIGISIIGSFASVVVRFRRSKGIERLQMKWLVYTAGLGISFLFILGWINQEIAILLFLVFPSLLIIAMGLAILRYRLFDIDIIIRRTLVYGVLTAILVALYFALVLGIQAGVTPLVGGQSTLAIVISTLVIAALFNPLRRRIQDLIDRRFYRRRYDAEETLVGFSLTVRDEVDLENISVALLRVVDETMQPESVSVWLRVAPQPYPPNQGSALPIHPLPLRGESQKVRG